MSLAWPKGQTTRPWYLKKLKHQKPPANADVRRNNKPWEFLKGMKANSNVDRTIAREKIMCQILAAPDVLRCTNSENKKIRNMISKRHQHALLLFNAVPTSVSWMTFQPLRQAISPTTSFSILKKAATFRPPLELS